MAAPDDGEDKKGKNKLGIPPGYCFVPKDLESSSTSSTTCSSAARSTARTTPSSTRRASSTSTPPSSTRCTPRTRRTATSTSSARESPRRWEARRRTRCAAAQSGRWKSVGNYKTVKSKKVGGGVAVGRKNTMVFNGCKNREVFDGRKTTWGMHEFTRRSRIIGPQGQDEVADLAVYRLYKITRKNGDEKAGRRRRVLRREHE